MVVDNSNRETIIRERYGAGHLPIFAKLLYAAVLFVCLVVIHRATGAPWKDYVAVFFLLHLVAFEVVASWFSLYRSVRIVRLRYFVMRLAGCWLLASAASLAVIVLWKEPSTHALRALLLWQVTGLMAIAIIQCSVSVLVRFHRAAGRDTKRVCFAGANDTATRLVNLFESHPWMGMEVVGVYDDRSQVREQDPHGAIDVKGTIEELTALARRSEVDIVYITLPMAAEQRIRALLDDISESTVSVYYCPSLFNVELMNASWDNVFGQPVVSLIESPFVGTSARYKALEDALLLLLLAPVVLPVIAIISLLVLITMGRPVFFTQYRYGRDGRPFRMWKFRTMYVDECEKEYRQASRGDSRITPLGALLRKTSLDELPQFFNVALGDMSIVGPRPHPDVVNEELRTRIHRYMVRHKIKPGITGLAQVNGCRGETESLDKMQRRIEYDLEYINSWSLWLDLKILIKTVTSLAGNDVY